MESNVDHVLLLPRYTSFAGATTFLTPPMNVRAYDGGYFLFTQVAALGSTPASLTVKVQQSPDLEIWTDVLNALTSGTPGERLFQFEWIRLQIALAGSDPAAACWCVADLTRRRA